MLSVLRKRGQAGMWIIGITHTAFPAWQKEVCVCMCVRDAVEGQYCRRADNSY